MLVQSQSFYVSVAHRYWTPQWSEERNREIYGEFASPEGLGGNFRVKLSAHLNGAEEIDWAPWIRDVKARIDHHCFFTDFALFQAQASTLERIARFLGDSVFSRPLASAAWFSLTVEESDRLGCTVYPQRDEVDLHVKTRNLHVCLRRPVDAVTGLAAARDEVERAVLALAPEFAEDQGESETQWSQRLFLALAEKIKNLQELRIDSGQQRSLCVKA